ncbi:MAG: phage integrase SAM-like domain-containing protein, partial [Bacteroidota bacterium]
QYSKSDYLVINQILNEYEATTIEIYREHQNSLSPEKFKEEILKRMDLLEDEEVMTFTKYFEQHLKEIEKQKGKTHQSYKNKKTIYNHLLELEKYTGKAIGFDDFNFDLMKAYQDWWIAKDGSNSINTIANYWSKMKGVLKLGFRDKLHANLAFDDKDLTIKKVKTKLKIRLTDEEVKRLISLDLSDNEVLERVQDVAIAAIHCGLRISDYQSLSLDRLKTDEKGNKYIEVVTKKITKPVILPVLPELEKVLKKYDGKLPIMSDQHFNRKFKEVLQRCIPNSTYTRIYNENGKTISENCFKWQYASSHACRRTFATHFYLVHKVPVLSLMAILAHATESQFFEYIDVSNLEGLD